MREAAFEIARQTDAFAPSIANQVVSAIVEPITLLRNAWMLAKLRAQLRHLDDHRLSDIGITRFDIDGLGADSLGTPSALETLMTEQQMPVKGAEILRFRRRGTDCAWPCVRR